MNEPNHELPRLELGIGIAYQGFSTDVLDGYRFAHHDFPRTQLS